MTQAYPALPFPYYESGPWDIEGQRQIGSHTFEGQLKVWRVVTYSTHFLRKGERVLDRIITVNETWIDHFDPEINA
jgi:hypothetical protein